MMQQTSNTRSTHIRLTQGQLLPLLIVGLPLAGVLWFVYGIYSLPARNAESRRRHFQQQLAEVREGHTKHFSIYKGFDDLDLAQCAADLRALGEERKFTLSFSYTADVDPFLEAIRGVPGISEVFLEKSGATAAGLAHLATLPDLQTVSFYEMPMTDADLRALADCENLETLHVGPREPATITIAAILALPHLRRLTLYDTYPTSWIEPQLMELVKGRNLEELDFVYIKEERVAALRNRLPNCKIRVNEKGK